MTEEEDEIKMETDEHHGLEEKTPVRKNLQQKPNLGSEKRKASPSTRSASDIQVLVVYTGGTIGMTKGNDNEYVTKKGHLYDLMSKNASFGKSKGRSKLSAKDRSSTSTGDARCTDAVEKQIPTMELSWTSEKGNFKITYGILEYDPLCDSSNMSLDDCKKIAKTIDDNYTTRFDGFVILHGTDTMAYTASALSYMLKDLTKSVVLTGSQKPMEELLTDATKNFLGALILAGPYSSTINEVGIFFHDQLFRGNRTTKHDASAFDGFSSPNRSCLATIGVDVKVNNQEKDCFQRSREGNVSLLSLQDNMSSEVGAFVIFPGITALTMKSCLETVEGAVILTYGAGNGPDGNTELMEVFKEATERGVLLVNITQCLKGEVKSDLYATGRKLEEVGLITGKDMTLEAALTKLSYVIGQNWSNDDKKRALKGNLRGELGNFQEPHVAL